MDNATWIARVSGNPEFIKKFYAITPHCVLIFEIIDVKSS